MVPSFDGFETRSNPLRLYQLFYVTALMAASVNLFGLTGIAVGAAIIAAWYYVYSGGAQERRSKALEVLAVAAMEREIEVPTERDFQAGWTELSAKTRISLGNRLWG